MAEQAAAIQQRPEASDYGTDSTKTLKSREAVPQRPGMDNADTSDGAGPHHTRAQDRGSDGGGAQCDRLVWGGAAGGGNAPGTVLDAGALGGSAG